MVSSTPSLFELPRTATTSSTLRSTPITPLLKWPGGKSRELERILDATPPTFDRYFEPFVGGGAAYFAVRAEVPAFINDASSDLIDLYRFVQEEDSEFIDLLFQIDEWWRAIADHVERTGERLVNEYLSLRKVPAANSQWSLTEFELSTLRRSIPDGWTVAADQFIEEAAVIVPRKLARMRNLERKKGRELPLEDVWGNIEGAFKASCYTALRTLYNRGRVNNDRSSRQASLFFFLREYAYAAMFRFNAKGEFNVPYGGISYNRKAFRSKIEHLRSGSVVQRLSNTTIECKDFEDFFEAHPPQRGDFVFLDPPYDSDFSDYDLKEFDRKDHRRLSSVMSALSCSFVLVIKSTPAIHEIYNDSSWGIFAFDKKYMWTIKGRNDRDVTHLMITNSTDVAELAS